MHNNDTLLQQAADHTMYGLKRFLAEPDEDNRQALVATCKHYNTQGVQITLKPDPAVIVRRLNV